MKKILFILLFLFAAFIVKAQNPPDSAYPIKQSVANTPTSLGLTNAMKASDGFINAVFTDTTQANLFSVGGKIKYYPGAQIFTTSDTSIWLRTPLANAWVKSEAGSVDITSFEFTTDSTITICFGSGVCITVDMINNVFVTQNTFDSTINNFATNIIGCNYVYPQGLLVSWSGSLLDFDVTSGTANINCNAYEYGDTTVTLSPGDATYDRFDVIGVDTNNNIIVIEGTPAADPQIPQVDPASQLALTTVLVTTGATTPTDIVQTVMKDEGLANPTEWDFVTNAWTNSVAAVQDDVSDPYHLTKDILVSNTGTVSLLGAYIRLDAPDTLLVTDGYSLLKVYVKLNFAFNPNQGFRFTWMFGGSVVSNTVSVINGILGFDRTNTTTYQNLTIPFGLFVFSDTAFDQLLIQPINSSKGFLLDYIQLQQGLEGTDNFGNYINNQYQAAQTANYWISGNGKVEGQLSSPNVLYNYSEKFGRGAAVTGAGGTIYGGLARGGTNSVAIGYQSNGNTGGIAIGANVTANSSSVAIGGTTTAAGAVAIGQGSSAVVNSGAFGSSAVASGSGGAWAIGYGSQVGGTQSIGIGNDTKVTHNYSVVIGNGDTSTTANQFLVGRNQTRFSFPGVSRSVAGYVLTDSLGTGQYLVFRPASSGAVAYNGLSNAVTGTDSVALGGTLTGNTTIAANPYTLSITGTTVNPFSVTSTTGNAISATAVGGSSAAVYANQTSGYGVLGDVTNGIAVQGNTTTSGLSGSFYHNPSSTNTVVPVVRISRYSSGTVSDGVGGNIEFYVKTHTGSTNLNLTNELKSKWSTSDYATRTSQFIITGVNSAVTGDIAYFNGNGMVGIGDATASATRLNVVDNAVAGASIAKISSTSTAAASSSQIGLNIALSGANSNSSEQTWGLYAENTHTGTNSVNNTITGIASGGTSNYGVRGSGSGASASNNFGGYFIADGASATNNIAGQFSASGGTNNYAIIVPSTGGTTGLGTTTPTATKLDIVDNTVGANSIVNISSTSTAAASNLQKGINVSLSGANGTASQTTYGAYISNAHSGTTPINTGLYVTVSNGSSSNVGVDISAGSGYGVVSNTTSGQAIRAISSAGRAIYASGVGSSAIYSISTVNAIDGVHNSASTNTVEDVLVLSRLSTGTAADGIGGAIKFVTETDGGSSLESNVIISKWATAADATRTSKLLITGVNSSTIGDIISFEGNKRTMLYGRLEQQQGADVASVAGAIAVGLDGNTFELTGTNAVTLISNLNWVNGSEITFVFTSTATLTDGTANSGTDIGMELAGNANFVGSADDVITLVLSEIGGTQRWREKSRSVN